MIRITKTVLLFLALTMIAAATANADGFKEKAKIKGEAAESLSGVAMELGALALPGVQIGAQIKDELFAGTDKFAQGASSVTEINLDPKTMGMVGRSYGYGYGNGLSGGKEGNLASKMNFMVVHKYKYDKAGMYNLDDVEVYRKKLADGSWNCPIRMRSKTSSTDICSRTASDNQTNEMVIFTVQPTELTFIHMSGMMSLEDLNRMSEGTSGIRMRTLPDLPDPREIRVPKVVIVPPAATTTPTPPTPPTSPR